MSSSAVKAKGVKVAAASAALAISTSNDEQNLSSLSRVLFDSDPVLLKANEFGLHLMHHKQVRRLVRKELIEWVLIQQKQASKLKSTQVTDANQIDDKDVGENQSSRNLNVNEQHHIIDEKNDSCNDDATHFSNDLSCITAYTASRVCSEVLSPISDEELKRAAEDANQRSRNSSPHSDDFSNIQFTPHVYISQLIDLKQLEEEANSDFSESEFNSPILTPKLSDSMTSPAHTSTPQPLIDSAISTPSPSRSAVALVTDLINWINDKWTSIRQFVSGAVKSSETQNESMANSGELAIRHIRIVVDHEVFMRAALGCAALLIGLIALQQHNPLLFKPVMDLLQARSQQLQQAKAEQDKRNQTNAAQTQHTIAIQDENGEVHDLP